jgi:type III secretory pathway component EscT
MARLVEIQGRDTHHQDKWRRVWQALEMRRPIAMVAICPMLQKSALGKSLKGGMLSVALS